MKTTVQTALKTAVKITMLLLCLVALPAVAQTPVNQPPAVEEARTRFQAGVQLFHEGNLEAALAEFRKAYQLAPSYRVLYNIAQVQVELHDSVEATKSFRQYLIEGNGEIPGDRRAQVEAELQKLERRISTLEITTDVPGAELLVDDVPVGTTPLRTPILVNAGVRRITAAKAGRVTTARTLTVAGGDRVHVDLSLPEAVAVRTIERPAPAPVAHPRTKMWVGLATTAALGIGAGTMALVTRQAKQDFETQLHTFPNTREAIDHARHHMVVDAAVTDGLTAAAIVAAGVTVFFAVTHPADEPESRRAQVQVAPTPGGLAVYGRF